MQGTQIVGLSSSPLSSRERIKIFGHEALPLGTRERRQIPRLNDLPLRCRKRLKIGSLSVSETDWVMFATGSKRCKHLSVTLKGS